MWQDILIPGEESSFDNAFKVATLSPLCECGQPIKLPDCVPVEIKSECVLF